MQHFYQMSASSYSYSSSHSTCRKTWSKRRFDHSTEKEPKDTPGIYKPRNPQRSILYRVVQQNLETWLTARREADPDDYPIPNYVETAFRKYLQCGIWAYGFARCRCPSCGYEYLLSFSCQIRGLCPSCNAKYMAQTAAHLIDNVLPFVPFRQVVLTVPKRIRFFLQNARHKRGIQRIFLRALENAIRKASPGAPKHSRFGAVVFTHRSGSSLNRHLHFHVVTTSGTFKPDDDDGSLVFFQATKLDDCCFNTLTAVVRRRILRYLVRHDLLDEWDASQMLTWQGHGGFSINGSVVAAADDRFGLERLLRYCARPVFASNRLVRIDDQQLIYKLPDGDVWGRDHIKLSPMELLDRLAALIPPPRRHRHTYAGVFAPNSRWRPLVAATAGPDPTLAIRLHRAAKEMGLNEQFSVGTDGVGTDEIDNSDESGVNTPFHPEQKQNCMTNRKANRKASIMWALLMARIFEVMPLSCPYCSSPMKVISFITDPTTINKILSHLGLPTKPPTTAPARAPPQIEMLFAERRHRKSDRTGEDDLFDQTHWPNCP